MRNSLLVILLRQWFVVAAAVGVFIAGWAAYLCVTTPLYTSTARLHVQRRGPRGRRRRARRGSADFLHTQARSCGSTPVLAIAASDPSVAGVPQLNRTADPVDGSGGRWGWRWTGGSARIEVSFDAAEPQAADRVLAAVIAAYRRYVAVQRPHAGRAGCSSCLPARRSSGRPSWRKVQQLQDHARQYGTPTTRAAEGDRSNPIGRRLAEVSESLAAAQRAAEDAAACARRWRRRSWPIRSTPRTWQRFALPAPARVSPASAPAARGPGRTDGPAASVTCPATRRSRRRSANWTTWTSPTPRRRMNGTSRRSGAEADAQCAFDDLQKEAREQRAHAAEYAWLEAEVNVARRHLEALENRIDEAARASAPRIDVLTSPRAASEPTKPQPGALRGWRWSSGCSPARRWRRARRLFGQVPGRGGRRGGARPARAGEDPRRPAAREAGGGAATGSGESRSRGNRERGRRQQCNGNGNGDRGGNNGGSAGERDPFADVATAYLTPARRGRFAATGHGRSDPGRV